MGLIRRLNEWLSCFSHKRFLQSEKEVSAAWTDNQLVCPVCGKLLAYRFFLHGQWEVHVCQPCAALEEALIRANGLLTAPPVFSDFHETWDEFYQTIHQRDPLYDAIVLQSDIWDDILEEKDDFE